MYILNGLGYKQGLGPVEQRMIENDLQLSQCINMQKLSVARPSATVAIITDTPLNNERGGVLDVALS